MRPKVQFKDRPEVQRFTFDVVWVSNIVAYHVHVICPGLNTGAEFWLLAKIAKRIIRKSSIEPPGSLFISSLFEGGGVNRDGGGVFNLEMTMVSVLQKELHQFCRIQSGKAQLQEVLGHAVEDQKQIRTSS